MSKITPPETAPEKDSAEGKEAHKGGFVQTLRDKSLRIAGASFLVADSSLIAYGYKVGEGKIASAGIMGLTAGFVGTRYGNPKAEKQLEQIYHRLGSYLRKQGVEIPENPSTETLAKKGGLLDHIQSFLYSHPSQVMNVFYGLIGLQFARSAIEHKKKSLFASGCLLMSGALGGILIEEKKPDPKHPPEGAVQKALSWVQEKPLRLTGALFNANQAFLALDALGERRKNPADHSYLLKLLAVTAFTFGNTMVALSSKSEGGGKLDNKSLSNLAETSARVIAAQKPEMQQALLEHVAGFLASDPRLRMNAEQISKMLHEKIEAIKQAPLPKDWQERVSNGQNTEAKPTR